MEVAGDESKTYQIALGALDERTNRAHVSIGTQMGSRFRTPLERWA